jgi:hypothetical protein
MEPGPTKGRSIGLLHVVTATDEKRGMVAFCCESHPLTRVRSSRPVLRCPFCRQSHLLDREQRIGILGAGMLSR